MRRRPAARSTHPSGAPCRRRGSGHQAGRASSSAWCAWIRLNIKLLHYYQQRGHGSLAFSPQQLSFSWTWLKQVCRLQHWKGEGTAAHMLGCVPCTGGDMQPATEQQPRRQPRRGQRPRRRGAGRRQGRQQHIQRGRVRLQGRGRRGLQGPRRRQHHLQAPSQAALAAG